jgi:hypothetical protein
MLANMVCSLIIHKRITTTLAKAKAARSVAEKMVTLGKKATLHSRRLAAARLHQEDAVKILSPKSLLRKRSDTVDTPASSNLTSARATPPRKQFWSGLISPWQLPLSSLRLRLNPRRLKSLPRVRKRRARAPRLLCIYRARPLDGLFLCLN